MVEGNKVTLTGVTGSRLQREAAEWAAAKATWVTEVDNRITVVDRLLPVGDSLPEE